MSNLTENTIVVRREAEERLKHDLEAGREWCKINGDRCVFRNDDYAVYVFDCNGDQPWDVMFGDDLKSLQLSAADIFVTETKYGNGRWTRAHKNGAKNLLDTRLRLITYMKNRLAPEEYDNLKRDIAYSI